MTRTYSLAEVAAAYLPTDWQRPVLWLQRRLRRGEISGYKVGHDWRMTEADVEAFVAKYHNATKATPPAADPTTPRPLSFTATSARRMRAAS